MYYACYYAVAALLLKHGICVKTHSGIRQAFSKEFVLTGQIDKEQSKFYSNLYANRQSGDYDDFIMMNEDKAVSYTHLPDDKNCIFNGCQ